MSAANEPREIIEQASRDGLLILRDDAPETLRLRGTPEAMAKWKPIIAQHKTDILPLVEAANDAGRTLPGVIEPAADPFDREQFGIECLSYLHAHGLLLALEAGRIMVCGSAAPRIVEEAHALIELHRDDLLAAMHAQETAKSASQRTAAPCWRCRYLRTTTSATDRLPSCDRGHGLVYRAMATRTWPARLDAQDCGDRTA